MDEDDVGERFCEDLLRLVEEWMKMMLVRGLVKILWYCWTLMRELAPVFFYHQL